MRKSLFIIISLTFFACGETESRVVEQPAPYNLDSQEVMLLYTRHCVDCHGERGDLGLMGAVDLTTSTMSQEERMNIIRNGSTNGKMKPFGIEHYGDLDDSEIAALAVYIESFRTEQTNSTGDGE